MRLLIRADGSETIGSGHLFRSSALAAEAISRGICVTPVSHCTVSGWRCRLGNAADSPIASVPNPHPSPSDLNAMLKIIANDPPEWVVLDGYHFDAEYRNGLRGAGVRVLAIDDFSLTLLPESDATLNPAASATRNRNELFGPRYALLRSEFSCMQQSRALIRPIANRLLLTFGGSDPSAATIRVIDLLERSHEKPFEIRVVVGARNADSESLIALSAASRHCIDLLFDASDMRSHMAWAEMAISAAGGTSWELACMGVPTILLQTADNQSMIAGTLSRFEAAIQIDGIFPEANEEELLRALSTLRRNATLRERLRDRARTLADGKGAGRVIEFLSSQARRK